MLQVTYKERWFIDKFTCMDRVKQFKARSYFKQGGLLYFRTGDFTNKVIDGDFIISIQEAK